MTPVTGAPAAPSRWEGREGALGRLARQRRVRCRLAAEVLDRGRRPVRASVCSLSWGGLSVEVGLRIEQGDSIRLRILPHRRARAVTVEAIVWNDRPVRGAARKGAHRLFGCVVSDPPQAFLELIAEVEKRNGRAEPLPPSARADTDVDPPRSRAATSSSRSTALVATTLPAGVALPSFRVRVKRVGGERTRIFRARAESLSDATDRVRSALDCTEGAWEVLDTVKEGDVS